MSYFGSLMLALMTAVVTFGISVSVLICGWGMSPKSWGVIVMGTVMGFVIHVFAGVATKK